MRRGQHTPYRSAQVVTLLLLWVALGCTATLSAQQPFRKEFHLGVRGGATASRANMNPSFSQGYLLNHTAGVMARYIDEPYFGLQLEVNYANHGWMEDFLSLPYEFSRIFTYIEVPFMTHVFFDISPSSRLFFNIGPQVGFHLSDRAEANFDIENPPADLSGREQEQYTLPVEHPIDYGLTAGVGYAFKWSKSSLSIEGRYYYGFGDRFGNDIIDTFANSSAQVISVAVGYAFNIL